MQRHFGCRKTDTFICQFDESLVSLAVTLQLSLFAHLYPTMANVRNLITQARDWLKVAGSAKAQLEVAAPLKGLTILLAEDNRINQQVIEAFLKTKGAQVVLANDGLQAIEKLASQAIDIVLMDVQMPVLGGLEATLQIRQTSDHEALPIIGMSAAITGQVYRDCRESGMSDFISKPVNPDRLLYLLNEWLGRQRVSPETQRNEQVLLACTPQHADLSNEGKHAQIAAAASACGPGLPKLNGFDLDTTLLMVGEAGLVIDLLKLFYQEALRLPERLKPLIANQDWSAAQKITHQFIGSTGILGAESLHYCAERLDREFKAGGLAQNVFEDFVQALELSNQEIKQYLANYAIL